MRSSVIERLSLTGELSLSCSQRTADPLNVGKSSAVGQPTQPFILLGWIDEYGSKLQLDKHYHKPVVALYGERLRGKGMHGVR